MLGRFLAPNKLVLLRAYDRHFLGRQEHWDNAIAATLSDWGTIVGSPPFRGGDVGEYLPNTVWRDVDQPEDDD